MSSPSDPPPPVDPAAGPAQDRQPSTQEIPVVQPTDATAASRPRPPHPDAVAPPPVPAPLPADAPQPTGPVDFVPGLPGAGAPPPPPSAPQPVPPLPPAAPVPPATAEQPLRTWPDTLEPDPEDAAPTGRLRKERRTGIAGAPRERAGLIGLGLVVLSAVLLEVGLLLDFDSRPYWSLVPLWSAFASLCVLLALVAFAAFYPAGNDRRSGPAWRVAAAGLVGLAGFWLLVVLPTVATDRGFVLTAALAALGGALWVGPRSRDKGHREHGRPA